MRLFYEVQRHYEPVAEQAARAAKIVRNSLPYDREFPITHSLCARRGCLSAEGARELHASLEREANASVTVPKVVWQACWNRCNSSAIPRYVEKNWAEYAPDFNRTVSDLADMGRLVRRYYEAPVVALFATLAARHMVHTSDIWRLAALYLFGGVYFDVEVRLVRPLREVVNVSRAWSSIGGGYTINNAYLATPPGNPLFAQLLERAAEQGYEPVAREYIHYCREIYHVAKRSVCGAECAGNDTLQPGLYPAWPLDLELVGVRCHTEDKECRRMKRGRCCSAFNSDGEKLFDQRWPGFSKSF